MQFEVAKWTFVEGANMDPQGKAVIAATVRGSPTAPVGSTVEVADNPVGAFRLLALQPQLGVVVLEYAGDVDALALALPTEAATITLGTS